MSAGDTWRSEKVQSPPRHRHVLRRDPSPPAKLGLEAHKTNVHMGQLRRVARATSGRRRTSLLQNRDEPETKLRPSSRPVSASQAWRGKGQGNLLRQYGERALAVLRMQGEWQPPRPRLL